MFLSILTRLTRRTAFDRADSLQKACCLLRNPSTHYGKLQSGRTPFAVNDFGPAVAAFSATNCENSHFSLFWTGLTAKMFDRKPQKVDLQLKCRASGAPRPRAFGLPGALINKYTRPLFTRVI